MPRLTSEEVPINPYRIVWELSRMVDSSKTIITHGAGSPRNQLVPFYQAIEPRSYIGWGKSHSLGTWLGLIIGTKTVLPEKMAINIMGDAAFGMVGTDFETEVRNEIPIITMVFKNSTMASEIEDMPLAHELYGFRDLSGSYADVGRAMSGHSQRVERPNEIVPAIQRAIEVTEKDKLPALPEFICSVEGNYFVL
jgi:acetolactate synthase-1/2/3 large subunit